MKSISLTKLLGISVALFTFFVLTTSAHAAAFYFTNTVDQSPTELGNYFDDPGFGTPSAMLPNNNVDEVYITSGAVYDGNATFNGSATNEGEVTGNAVFNDNAQNNNIIDGNAVFNGDSSEDNNTILGTKTRHYTVATTTTRDFSNWIVIADGVAVDITGATDDSSTIYQKPNSGSYVYDTSIYYFNNAVNTSPNTLGNYWHNEGLNRPAFVLPNFTTGTIHVATGATFNGNIIFNNDAVNNGVVTGNALFNEDSSQNLGTVTGTKTRKYTADFSTSKDFVTDGPWIVVADGATVNISNASFDNTTTFTEINNGKFIDIALVSAYVYQSTITLTYSGGVDATSVPSAGDFVVLNNGAAVTVSNVSISGSQVIVTIASSVLGGSLSISYTIGANPLRSSIKHFGLVLQGESVRTIIPVTNFPAGGISFNNKLYFTDDPQNGGVVSVAIVNPQTNTVLNTIPLGIASWFYVGVGNKLYVMNYGSGTISIISTDTDQLVTTFPLIDPNTSLALVPYRAVVVGTDLYIAGSGGAKVAVLDTNTNTVTDVIATGGVPYYLLSYRDKIYELSSNNSSINVINTTTKNIVKTFTAADGLSTPVYAVVAHDKIFIANHGALSMIDYATDTISNIATTNANNIILANDKLYLVGTSEIWVHSAMTGSFLATVIQGTFSSYGTVSGNTIFIPGGDKLNIINTVTDTISSIDVIGAQYVPVIQGDSIYVSSSTHKIIVIDKNSLPSLLPNLISFSTASSSGLYTSGQSIPITANFGRTLQSGSTMTILLNNGAAVTLNQVSGATLSGTYTIGSNQLTPDLAVQSIASASVSDGAHTRTTYDLPTSFGSFTGENSAITRNLGDTKNIQIGTYDTRTTGSNPYQVLSLNGFLYVANQGANTVSVINQSTGVVIATIPVGQEPYGIALSGTTLYIANVLSNTVSVIDTTTNTVTATISVGIKPYYVATIGTNVYVTNGASNTVSVINTNTNMVTNTIAVGSYPRGIKAHGTDLYVANYGDPNYSGGNSISVIDSLTNTVTNTIILPAGSDGPRGVTVLGSKVYVANYRSNNVSVIDTATNTIVQTIAVGAGPRGIIGLGTKIYVENFDDGTISVIDTLTNTVSITVTVGHSPAGMAISGTDIYLTSFQDNKVYILDTTTNTLRTTTPVVVVTPTPSSGGGGSSGGSYFIPIIAKSTSNAVSVVEILYSGGGTGFSCKFHFTKDLKFKSKNKEVGHLQICLNTLENTNLKVDNYFGTKTQAATRLFQKENHLKQTGVVDKKMRKVINKR